MHSFIHIEVNLRLNFEFNYLKDIQDFNRDQAGWRIQLRVSSDKFVNMLIRRMSLLDAKEKNLLKAKMTNKSIIW